MATHNFGAVPEPPRSSRWRRNSDIQAGMKPKSGPEAFQVWGWVSLHKPSTRKQQQSRKVEREKEEDREIKKKRETEHMTWNTNSDRMAILLCYCDISTMR